MCVYTPFLICPYHKEDVFKRSRQFFLFLFFALKWYKQGLRLKRFIQVDMQCVTKVKLK